MKSTKIHLPTGVVVDPFNLSTSEVFLPDIAHSLAHQCRFGGRSSRFYSVAEHSVLTVALSTPMLALEALLHDASEAYLLDLPGPLKNHPMFVPYKILETQVDQTIRLRFGLPLYPHPFIKRADKEALTIEARALFPPNSELWSDWVNPEVLPFTIHGWNPHVAKSIFLSTFNAILKDPNAAQRTAAGFFR